MGEYTAIPPSLTEIYPLPWSVRPLDHKYYGTEILDANSEVVDGIRVWMGRLDAKHPIEWLSPREDWEPGDELSHREDIHSYAIVRAIVTAVNTAAALDGAFGPLHPDQVVVEGLTS